ncbi:MAG: methionyl-tRNA formyltransferase [Bacteroidales bacterium]|nr:methionyl-tRNA formyltransferase [Bacteroidales bacterium]
MKIVFMGTPQFAAYTLKELLKSQHQIVAVVTVPDKPAGRGLKLKQSEVKQIALEHQIPLLQPERLKDESFIASLKSYQADLFVVVAFRMLPKEVWSIPPKGTINIHASLLPQYRGAAPINWAIINGEKTTGVTLFFINEQIDCGKIINFKEVPILPHYNAGMLHDVLMQEGAQLLISTLPSIEFNEIEPIEQSSFIIQEQELKSAPKITPELCKINWSLKIEQIHNLIRGLSPYPAAFTTLINLKNNKTLHLKIFSSEIIDGKHESPCGTIITDKKNYLYITADGGILQINECQPEGKKRMTIKDFLNGFKDIEDWKIIDFESSK